LGAFAGAVGVERQEAGLDLGVLGRFRLGDYFQLEAEVAQSEMPDKTRTDRRLGLALLYDINPRGTISPYLVGGVGYGQTHIDRDELRAQGAYGEVGLGIHISLTEHLILAADVRGGLRRVGSDEMAMRTETADASLGAEERYLRGRAAALIFF
jgi:hypothetical protein